MNKQRKVILVFVCIFIISIVVLILLNGVKKENLTGKEDENKKEVNKLETLLNLESLGTYNNPTIPNGFKKVETSTASWEVDENGIVKGWNNGLVIEDEIGNQFVWIPVKDIERFCQRYRYYFDISNDEIKKYSEPNYINQTVESKALYESVKKYQGFYIARYEAGLENRKDAQIFDGSIKPVSKANVVAWSSVPWGSAYGYAMDKIQGDDRADGAVKISRSMYPDMEHLNEYKLNKDLKNETGAISTLCYGVQWDAIIDFLSDVENPFNNTKYIEDGEKMGWFAEENAKLTGTNIDDRASNCVKNIYDMAGNLYEWTMGGYDNHYRVYRGGNYEMGRGISITTLSYGTPEYATQLIGFRVALYIK